jgi:hypothetical protein
MHCLAEEPKELTVWRPEEVESLVGEHPVVFPVAPVDAVLVDISSCVAHAAVVRRHSGEIIETREKVILGKPTGPIDAGGGDEVNNRSPSDF